MSKKKETFALLWNVPEKRVESVHDSKKAAEAALERFAAKSGDRRDTLDLDIAEFTVRQPPEPTYAPDPEKDDKKGDK